MKTIKFINNRGKVLSEMERKKKKILTKIGARVHGFAVKLAPVGTPESTGKKKYTGGILKKSLAFTVKGDSVHVGSNVEYAPYVELGTVKMKAKPFLTPAITDHTELYKSMAKEILEK